VAALFHKMGMVWTLKFEWLFYLLFPLIAAIVRTSLFRIFLVTAVLGIVFVHPPMLLSGDTESSHFFAFFLGACSAWLSHQKWLAPIPVLVVLLLGWVAATLAYVKLLSPDFLGSGRVSFQVVVGLLFLPLVQLGRHQTAFLRWFTDLRGVQALGVISYSLYLYHMVVIHYVMALVHRRFEGDLAVAIAAVPVTLLSIVLSIVSYLYVERRFLAAPTAVTTQVASA